MNPLAVIFFLCTVTPIVGIGWSLYYIVMQGVLPYLFLRQAPVIITSLFWMAVPLYCELPWWYNLLFLQHLVRLNGYWYSFNEIWDKRKEENGGACIRPEEQEEIRQLAHLHPTCQSGNSIADVIMWIGFAGNIYYLYLKFFG